MTNNKQQTAVEWLQSIELERNLTLADWKKAKEMEKEQHRKTWHDSFDYFFLTKWIEFNEYYEQTYGGAEQ
jgi:hypothetical protein